MTIRSTLAPVFYRATGLHTSLPTGVCEKWLELTSLRRFLTAHSVDCILDVGGNIGTFVTKVRRLGYKGRIVSFEPDPRAYRKLLEMHAKDGAWEGINIALGDVEGTFPFHLAKESFLSSLLTPVHEDAVAAVVEVPVKRLDAIWHSLREADREKENNYRIKPSWTMRI